MYLFPKSEVHVSTGYSEVVGSVNLGGGGGGGGGGEGTKSSSEIIK